MTALLLANEIYMLSLGQLKFVKCFEFSLNLCICFKVLKLISLFGDFRYVRCLPKALTLLVEGCLRFGDRERSVILEDTLRLLVDLVPHRSALRVDLHQLERCFILRLWYERLQAILAEVVLLLVELLDLGFFDEHVD